MRKTGNPDLKYIHRPPIVTGVNASLEDAFHNATDCSWEVEREKPWHRVAIFMYAQGKTFTEIGESLGKSHVTVSQLIRQPWAQARLIAETTEAGRDNIQAIFDVYGPATLLEVVDLGNSARSETVRLAAKRDFLNRWLGMPKESMLVTTKDPETKTDDELRASVNTILNGLSRPSGVPDSGTS